EVRRKHVVPGALAHLLQLYWWENASVCTENVYPPNSAATVAITSSISPCSLTFPRQNIAVLPRPRRAFTVAAPSGSFRPSTQTRAPSWAKTPAMPLPMPLVPPVTMTDLFLIDMSTESSLTMYFRLYGGKFAGKGCTMASHVLAI